MYVLGTKISSRAIRFRGNRNGVSLIQGEKCAVPQSTLEMDFFFSINQRTGDIGRATLSLSSFIAAVPRRARPGHRLHRNFGAGAFVAAQHFHRHIFASHNWTLICHRPLSFRHRCPPIGGQMETRARRRIDAAEFYGRRGDASSRGRN